MYEIIYEYDFIVAEDIDGNCEYDTETSREAFSGTHIELLDHIKQMKENGCYNIEATAICGAEDYDI